jgi:hypothetical protein
MGAFPGSVYRVGARMEVKSKPGGGPVGRALAILLRPKGTWAEIAGEATGVRRIFTGYVMILGAINPVCFTLGRLAFGERPLGVVYRPPVLATVVEGVLGYVFLLGSVFALSLLIEGLAGPFGALKDRLAAFKVAAYASTAGWAASVFYLVPPIQSLALIGQLYTLYLLYLGVETLLRPRGRTLGYVALVVVSYGVLMMLAISLTKLLAALV